MLLVERIGCKGMSVYTRFWLPVLFLMIGLSGFAQQVSKQQIRVPEEIIIEAPDENYDSTTGIISASGGVVITAEKTKITADEITYNTLKGLLNAIGNIHLTDPAGEVKSSKLSYDFGLQYGFADEVEASSTGTGFYTPKLEITPKDWVARKVKASTGGYPSGPYNMTAKKMVIRPGRDIVATNVYLLIGKTKVLWLPWIRINLGQKVKKFPLPIVGYDGAKGFNLHMTQPYELSSNTAILGESTVYMEAVPMYRLRYSYSFDRNLSPITIPLNEEGERFNTAFIDQVRTTSVAQEEADLRINRTVAFAEHSENVQVFGRRLSDMRISKDWELGFQTGMPVGPLLGVAVFRVGRIREFPGRTALTRYIGEATVVTHETPLFGDFSGRLKVHAATFAYNEHGGFGWVRPSAELYWRPTDKFAFGLAYIRSIRFEDPGFIIDDVDAREAFHFRLDTRIGSSQISTVLKYDTLHNDFYDIQARLGVLVNCLEVVLTYRKHPAAFEVTFNLTSLDALEEVFRKRLKEVSEPVPSQEK